MTNQHLPTLNTPVIALCQTTKGKQVECEVKRIISKDCFAGWQWSGIHFNTYFTLKVISWKPLKQYSLFK